MRRVQLEHAIRTACQIIGHPAVIIVGSQAILGSFGEGELPVEATMSVEVDVLPIADSNTVIAELADLIEGVAGEWSPFEEMHGFSIAGYRVYYLPDGGRLVVLLCGGDKSTQQADISKAYQLADQWRRKRDEDD